MDASGLMSSYSRTAFRRECKARRERASCSGILLSRLVPTATAAHTEPSARGLPCTLVHALASYGEAEASAWPTAYPNLL
jgi:hypothetical protein